MTTPRRDLLVEVRDPTFQRVGQIDDRDIADLKLTLRLNNLGGWSLTLPHTSPGAQQLRVPGSGIVVTLDSEVILSGPVVKGVLRQQPNDVDEWTFEGVDDNWVLADRLAWPNPGSDDLSAQQGDGGYDVRRGPAETVIRMFVAANAGSLAPASRRVPVLDMAPDGARGMDVVGRTRFEPLGQLCERLALLSGLVFRVRANGDRLLFEVTERRDVSGLFRFDALNDTAEDAGYSYEAPGVTRPIVAGQGQASARVFVARTNLESRTAEQVWGRRIERFIDRRDVADVAELQQAGDEELADEGMTRTSMTVTPVDTPASLFWTDWRLGDVVSAVVRDVHVKDVVSSATVTYGPQGLAVTAVMGPVDEAESRQSPAARAVGALVQRLRRISTRTGRLERQ